MRNFQILDQANVDTAIGIITFTAQEENAVHASVAMRREGDYIVISTSYGALEIALRLRFNEFARTVRHLHPNDGLNTTRQVGTGDAHLTLGLRSDGALIFRPVLIADASGHLNLNLTLAPIAVTALHTWIGGEQPPETP